MQLGYRENESWERGRWAISATLVRDEAVGK